MTVRGKERGTSAKVILIYNQIDWSHTSCPGPKTEPTILCLYAMHLHQYVAKQFEIIQTNLELQTLERNHCSFYFIMISVSEISKQYI